ncbi:MAG: AAA family ATPase [Polyangiaceae bacterium]
MEPSPSGEITAEVARAEGPRQARTREVALLVVSRLGAAASAAEVRASIEASGGRVTAADGAELRAVFGLASDEGRDVRDALRAALAITARDTAVGAAVDLGRALVDERGAVVEDAGASARFARAAALAASSSGRVLVPPEVVRAAGEAFAFGSESGRAFVTHERPRPLATSRFVGRRAELARLGARWEEAQGGRATVVALTGEAGVGKTRLALELERRILLSLPSTRTRFLTSRDGPWEALDLVVIEAFQGVAEPLARARRGAEGAGTGALFVIVARELDAELRPLVDEELRLGPLSEDEATDLAASLLGARLLVPELLERLGEVAERTPLFLTETVRDWMDQAVVVVRDGVAVLHAGALDPPRTLRALVEARLDRLGPEDLTLLRASAIAGDEASAEEVSAMMELLGHAPRDLGSLDGSLLGPADADTGSRSLRPLVRQVALDTVPKEARRALHAAAEKAIAASPPSPKTAARRAERVGVHRFEAGDGRGALSSFVHAAHAFTRPADRARAAAQALRLLPPIREPLDPALLADVPRLVGMLASAADQAGASEGWLDLARDAFERIDRDGALPERVVVRLEAARLGVQLAAVPEARVALDQASNLAVDVRLRARVLATEMELALSTGEIGRGRDAASALFDLSSTHPLREIESPVVLADAAEIFGAARDERAAEAALGLALDIGADGSPSVRAAIEARRARVDLLLGQPARALRTSMIAVDLADAAGAMRLRADAKLALAESSIHAGRLDRAYAALVAALEAAESSGHGRAATAAQALLLWLDAPADTPAARDKLGAIAARCDARGFAADALAVRLLAARLLEGDAARDALRSIESAATRLGHLALAADAAAALASR